MIREDILGNVWCGDINAGKGGDGGEEDKWNTVVRENVIEVDSRSDKI